MKFSCVVVFSILLTACVSAGQTSELTARETAPVVVNTHPESGAENVAPSLSEIRVTFSREMMDNSWSWVQVAPENFPKHISNPRYLEDGKTCVVDVQLEPGKTYIIWLNTQKFRNFRDRGGNPAVPYLLTFDTRH
ncbi:MAG: Ig-like domain-containing protein [Nitrospirota bacterium]